MNNHSGSAQGQAGAVMHFLLTLPWKLMILYVSAWHLLPLCLAWCRVCVCG